MKEIIINEHNLEDKDIDSVVRRAKLVVENSKGELLLVKCHDNCYLIGGHVDGDEIDNDTLIREIREEAGVDFDPAVSEPFYRIVYYTKDYPQEGINTKYIANYYDVIYDLEPDEDNLDLMVALLVLNLVILFDSIFLSVLFISINISSLFILFFSVIGL